MTLPNADVADIFDQIADLLEFQGANPFRVRAYRNGARTVRDLPEPIEALVRDDSRQLTDIPGIGKDLAAKCAELVTTGRLAMFDDLLRHVPRSVLDLMRVPGMGPKKAAAVFHELGVTDLEQLESACRDGQVRALKGFGQKTEQTILSGISIAAAANQRILWAAADRLARQLLEHLGSCEKIEQIAAAGSYRRGCETVGDLDVLVAASQPDAIMDRLAQFPLRAETLLRGDTKMSIRLESGLQVDLRVVPRQSFGAALQYFTGSKDHNVQLRARAKQLGLKINEYGVYRTDPGHEEPVAGATEEGVYAALRLPLFPPELREARQELQWAEQGELPRLIELDDIRGDLHMHTVASDGKATLEEMVEASQQLGRKYIAITDHSPRVTMARGLDAQRLRTQWDEIDRLNERLGRSFTLLKGIECDILEAGGMDLPDDLLAQADWVLASIHYGQRQSRSQITERMLGAIENPHVSAIAHPTGRLLNRREAYQIDLDAVFTAARQHGTLLELNAHPQRLDLNDIQCAAAQRQGIPIVIGSDAHSVDGLRVMRYGIQQARRAGLTTDDVANTRSWSQLQTLIGAQRT